MLSLSSFFQEMSFLKKLKREASGTALQERVLIDQMLLRF